MSDPAFSPDEVYLQLYRKGQEDYDYDTDEHFRYKSDSVGVRYSRVAGVSYIFENGKFRRAATVD